MIDESNNIVLA